MPRHDGLITGLTALVVGPGRNRDTRAQYRIVVGASDSIRAIEDDLLVLTDAGDVVRRVTHTGDSCRAGTQHASAVFFADRFVRAA